jgi:hypothetical protein
LYHDIEEKDNIEHTTKNTENTNPDHVKKPCVKKMDLKKCDVNDDYGKKNDGGYDNDDDDD